MREEVQHDWEWADGYLGEIQRIITLNLGKIASIETSSRDQDLKQATDMVIKVDADTIAVRVRRDGYFEKFGDVTLRAWRGSGVETEIDKLRSGWGDWYLYMWTQDGQSRYWVLLDINQMRKSGILYVERNVIKNKTEPNGFVAITLRELSLNDCIVSCPDTESSSLIARQIQKVDLVKIPPLDAKVGDIRVWNDKWNSTASIILEREGNFVRVGENKWVSLVGGREEVYRKKEQR